MTDEERELLIKSLDSDLSPEERFILDRALQQSAELQAEKAHLLNLRRSLKSEAAKTFHQGFEDRVMARIQHETEAALTNSLFHIFRPVAVAAVLLIVITVSINVFSSDHLSIESILTLSDISPDEAFNPFVDLARE